MLTPACDEKRLCAVLSAMLWPSSRLCAEAAAAQARYQAAVSLTGLGRVTVAGKPKCTVQAPAGGRVVCGE